MGKRGVTGLEVFGPNYTFKASTVYDYSHRDRTKAETFQEPSEEDQLILRKDRDLGLHHNLIHLNSGLEIHVKPSYASGSTSNQIKMTSEN